MKAHFIYSVEINRLFEVNLEMACGFPSSFQAIYHSVHVSRSAFLFALVCRDKRTVRREFGDGVWVSEFIGSSLNSLYSVVSSN